MDYYNDFLQTVRKNHWLFLNEKSLKALANFRRGYNFGRKVEAWENSTGLNFYEHVNDTLEAVKFITEFTNHDVEFEILAFDEFVHAHYDEASMLSVKTPEHLISEMSSSEEEAFDKYFELHDAFLKQKNESGYINPIPKIIVQSDVDNVINEYLSQNGTEDKSSGSLPIQEESSK